MNVSLTKELERFVSRKVESGRYRSASEVVRESLRLLERQEGQNQFSFASADDLETKLVEGIDALDRGEHTPANLVEDALQTMSSSRRKKKHA